MVSLTLSDLQDGEESSYILEELQSPFPCLGVDLSTDDLRETAYEVFLASCGRSSSGRKSSDAVASEFSSPSFATLLPGSSRSISALSSSSRSVSSLSASSLSCSPPLQKKSRASSTFRRIKKALSVKAKKKIDTTPVPQKTSEVELMRSQMEIPEKDEARTLRALDKAVSVKVGRERGAVLVPIELLLNVKLSEFSDETHYQRWQKRQLRVLQAGLFHCSGKSVSKKTIELELKQYIPDFCEHSLEVGVDVDTLQIIRETILGLAAENSADQAENFPLNIYLYEMLLRSSFDSLEVSSFSEDCDDILILVKKTWYILGIDQMLHDSCLIWVLFRQFVISGQREFELLEAADSAMKDVWKRLKAVGNEVHTDILISVLISIQAWTDRRLLMYHEHFEVMDQDIFENLINIALSCTKISQYVSQSYQLDHSKESNVQICRIQVYIQSSLRYVFSQLSRQLEVDRNSYGNAKAPILGLMTLAKNIEKLAVDEHKLFCPIFRQWHPYPASVAAVTLHTCYRLELKQFLSSARPSIEIMQVLQSAAKLEKQLVQMATTEQTDSDERWQDIFDEMYSFASEPEVALVLRKWLGVQIGQLSEWSEKFLQEEEWNSNATREKYALSVVELFRMVDDTSNVFFKFPILGSSALVHEFSSAIDAAVDHYIYIVVAGCGRKEDYVPHLALSQGNESSASMLTKLNDSLWKKYEALAQYKTRVWPQSLGGMQLDQTDSLSIQCFCVRINSLYQVTVELELLEKKLRVISQEVSRVKATTSIPISLVTKVKFERSRASCQAGIERLFDIAAYKVVFWDLRVVFWDSLYLGGVSQGRIETVIQQLDICLEIIANTVRVGVRNQMVNYIMMACFESFLKIILYRPMALDELEIGVLKEDLKRLTELFIANGKGLPADLVEKAVEPVAHYISSLTLKQSDSSPNFKKTNTDASFGSGSWLESNANTSKFQFSGSTNTLSSVFGYKCHVLASKFVMKTYNSFKS